MKGRVRFSSFLVVSLKSNVVNSILHDLVVDDSVSGSERFKSVVYFVSEYCIERDDSSSEIMVRLVALPDFVTVDGDSGIRIKEVESSVVYSVVLGADVNIASTVLLTTYNIKKKLKTTKQ